MKLILTWLLAACALLVVAYLYPGVQVQSFTSALIAAAVIGLFNAVLRPAPGGPDAAGDDRHAGPVPVRHQRPAVLGRASVLDGFHVNGFWAALLGSLIYSALMLVVEHWPLRSVLR